MVKKDFSNGSTNPNTIVAILAIAVFVISIFSFAITVVKVNNLKKDITGYATTVTGTVNITILSLVSINITNSIMWWGGGIVTPGSNNATMYTNGTYTDANVTNGNWSTASVYGFVIKNDGNENVSINMSSGKNATDFLGTSVNSPAQVLYQWNASNKDDSACNFTMNNRWHNHKWTDINTSTTGLGFNNNKICGDLHTLDNQNEINIDIKLSVAADSSNRGDSLTDPITIVAVASH